MRNYDHILNLAKDLQDAGHRVSVPIDLSERGYSDRTKMKAEFMKNMFESIRSCDSILVVNDIDRGGYSGYIGPNTFLQLGLGFSLGKTLYCLENWDKRLPYNEELEAMNIRQLDIKLPH